LVVRDIDSGVALLQLLDFGTHIDAQVGINVGERLVKKGTAGDRALALGPSARGR
jgi:hypothetical protein